jgi:hypothetical protein
MGYTAEVDLREAVLSKHRMLSIGTTVVWSGVKPVSHRGRKLWDQDLSSCMGMQQHQDLHPSQGTFGSATGKFLV